MRECDDLFSVEEYLDDKNASKRNAACFVKCLAKEKVEDVVIDVSPDPKPRSKDGPFDKRAICKSTAKTSLSSCLKESYSWTKPVCYANHTAAKAACMVVPLL